MHIVDTYKTLVAIALARLCATKKRGGVYYLLRQEDNGAWRVNANALSRELEAHGAPIPQSTITRILNGATPQPDTIKALAEYFGVDNAVVRGEVGLDGRKKSAALQWPFDVSFRDFDDLDDEQKDIIKGLVRHQVTEFKDKNAMHRRKKSAGQA